MAKAVVAKAVATRGNRLVRDAALDQQRRERIGGTLRLEADRCNQSTGVKRLGRRLAAVQNGSGSSASAGSGAQASTRWATTSPTTTIDGEANPWAST